MLAPSTSELDEGLSGAEYWICDQHKTNLLCVAATVKVRFGKDVHCCNKIIWQLYLKQRLEACLSVLIVTENQFDFVYNGMCESGSSRYKKGKTANGEINIWVCGKICG